MSIELETSVRVPSRWRVLRVALTIAFVATCGTVSDGSCPAAFAGARDDSDESPCVREPAGQICDQVSQRCESVCDPSEYLVRCRGSALPVFEGPAPGEPPSCGPPRTPVSVPSGETLFCCKCEG